MQPSDVFSFGLTIHYALTYGSIPFKKLWDGTPNFNRFNISNNFASRAGNGLSEIVKCALDMNPKNRPTMAEITNSLLNS